MGRYNLRQLCVFVLACGVYFGGLPQLYIRGLREGGTDDVAAFTFEAILAWIVPGEPSMSTGDR